VFDCPSRVAPDTTCDPNSLSPSADVKMLALVPRDRRRRNRASTRRLESLSRATGCGTGGGGGSIFDLKHMLLPFLADGHLI